MKNTAQAGNDKPPKDGWNDLPNCKHEPGEEPLDGGYANELRANCKLPYAEDALPPVNVNQQEV